MLIFLHLNLWKFPNPPIKTSKSSDVLGKPSVFLTPFWYFEGNNLPTETALFFPSYAMNWGLGERAGFKHC